MPNVFALKEHVRWHWRSGGIIAARIWNRVSVDKERKGAQGKGASER